MGSIVMPSDGQLPLEWILHTRDLLLEASARPALELQSVLSVSQLCNIIESCYVLLKKEPTLVEVSSQKVDSCTVTVVGDTHGQFHDVVQLMEVAGFPSASSKFVFNGDYVDRGSWGLETLVWLSCWKIALPNSVYLLRGNHESTTCTGLYGFRRELETKYPASKDFKEAYKAVKKLFSALPLAALIEKSTLVVHGGLFRRLPQPPPFQGGKQRRKRGRHLPVHDCYSLPMELGSLKDLAHAAKGGVDPDGTGSSILATDVMWSDPAREPGLHLNHTRGIGLVFGPDVTQAFLEQNNLKLIIRSHEGPDARDKRADMGHMLEGYTIDHDVPAGRLMTVFSAPDYPQFQAGDRYANKAAVAVLQGPDFATPIMKQFTAVLPRPETTAFYDFADTPDSDEDIGLACDGDHGSDMSDWSQQGGTDAEPEDGPTSMEVEHLITGITLEANGGVSLYTASEPGPCTSGNVPDAHAATPSTAVVVPSTSADAPGTSAGIASTGADAPSMGVMISADVPGTGVNLPSTSADVPGMGVIVPSTSDDIPGMGVNLPSTGADVPGMGVHLPSTSAYVPGMGVNLPSTSAYVPGMGVNLPSTSAYVPGMGVNVPSTSADIPCMGVNLPSTSFDIPSTSADIPLMGVNLPSTAADVPSHAAVSGANPAQGIETAAAMEPAAIDANKPVTPEPTHSAALLTTCAVNEPPERDFTSVSAPAHVTQAPGQMLTTCAVNEPPYVSAIAAASMSNGHLHHNSTLETAGHISRYGAQPTSSDATETSSCHEAAEAHLADHMRERDFTFTDHMNTPPASVSVAMATSPAGTPLEEELPAPVQLPIPEDSCCLASPASPACLPTPHNMKPRPLLPQSVIRATPGRMGLGSPAKWANLRPLTSDTPDISPAPSTLSLSEHPLAALTPEPATEPSSTEAEGGPHSTTAAPPAAWELHQPGGMEPSPCRFDGGLCQSSSLIPGIWSTSAGGAQSQENGAGGVCGAGSVKAFLQPEAGGIGEAQESVLIEQVAHHNLNCQSMEGVDKAAWS